MNTRTFVRENADDNTLLPMATWYQALTIRERLLSLDPLDCRQATFQMQPDVVEQRINRWKSEPQFADRALFMQRLAMDGLNEDAFCRLLGEPIEAVKARHPSPPHWLQDFLGALASNAPTSMSIIHEIINEKPNAGFLRLIEPLLANAYRRLDEAIRVLCRHTSNLPFAADSIHQILFTPLTDHLLMMLNRTMALELNVARLQGLLAGKTSQERFCSFIERIQQREHALAILQEYPVLARQLAVCLNQWIDTSAQFLQRLCEDWPTIKPVLGANEELGTLVHVQGGAGDRHCGGQAVLIASFSSGFKVVYKPRSLALDVHFQQLLAWLNEIRTHPPFRTLRIIDRGTYGWVEYIRAVPCFSEPELKRFYQRQGAYLALLYAMNATDFHFENIIAAGEYPVLVDLETLFHPLFTHSNVDHYDQIALNGIANSVLRVGLLPQAHWTNDDGVGIDVSGLGGADGQLTPYRVPTWEGVGTDEMHLVRQHKWLSGGNNRPSFNGSEVHASQYRQSISMGFAEMYRTFIQHREFLMADDGPLARFRGDQIRIIVRPTRTYYMLLLESFHPDVLRDALERDLLFDRLWTGVADAPHLATLISAERNDLMQGDVPFFSTKADSCDLFTSESERLNAFLDMSGFAQVKQRIQGLNEQDLQRQLWFIEASFVTCKDQLGTTEVSLSSAKPLSPVSHARLIAAASVIGDRLEDLAIRRDGDVSWIGLGLGGKDTWSIQPLGIHLYDGVPGVALFLGYLGAVTKEPRYTQLAQAAMAGVSHKLSRVKPFIDRLGAFDGWGGVIYSLAQLGRLWEQASLLLEGKDIAELIPTLIDKDKYLDIISGAAGCIGGLLCLYQTTRSNRILDIAIQCGDQLVARAQPQAHGVGWVTASGSQALTGFSHGAAGMAWALLELWSLTGREQFLATGLKAIAYERSMFSVVNNNWPDLRDNILREMTENTGQRVCQTAWCHGAPGIGLGRIRALQHYSDAEMLHEIEIALDTTLRFGFRHSHCLCHGDLGNIELMLQARQHLKDPRWDQKIERLVSPIIDCVIAHKWVCGVPLGTETPGLMTGLAGIGYELLRLAEPAHVPSVLVLAPPLHHTSC